MSCAIQRELKLFLLSKLRTDFLGLVESVIFLLYFI